MDGGLRCVIAMARSSRANLTVRVMNRQTADEPRASMGSIGVARREAERRRFAFRIGAEDNAVGTALPPDCPRLAIPPSNSRRG
jgi:hypothetical protein